MKSIKVLACLVVCLLVASGVALGQGLGASGSITGTVTDPSGAVLPNATVTATDAERGIKRTTNSDNTGHYEITGLMPTIYTISTERNGFQTAIQKGVVVNVGQTVILDFHMRVSEVASSVEVTTEPPVVETERGHQSDTITGQYIQDLPINRRDYLTFSLLVPGVNDSTRLAGDQDFRVKQTPQSGLSFYGGNGRGNSVTVDGGEANDDSGGVRLTLSQDAVQEFQINRSNYGADLGGASGASINIVSKTGSNDLHGTLFGYFRNDAMDARNPFAFSQALQPGQVFNRAAPDVIGTPTKDTLTREQFGGSFGFPLSKDKTFGFVSAEGLIQNAQNAVPLLTSTSIFRPDSGGPIINGIRTGNNQQAVIQGLATLPGNPAVPCLTGQPALPAQTCAGILTNILTLNPATPLGSFLMNQFENNGGLFKYDTKEYFISGRLDHVFNDHNQVYLRYSFAHDNEQSPDVQSLVGFSAGSTVKAYDNTAQAAWFHQFSAKAQNELRGQFNYTNFDVIPNQPGEVGLNIPGFAQLGTNIFLPSLTIMRRPDGADNMTLVSGHHTMKFGGEFLLRGNHSESHTFFPGRFVFGNLPGGILSPCLQVPAACGLVGVNPAVINPLQSATLGLPQFYQQGFGNPIYNYPRAWSAEYWQDQWAITPNFNLTFGVRYELDAQYGKLQTDKNNVAPRASFAWDPFKDHKVAIRGGFGIFYSPIYGQIADVVQTLGFVNGTRPIAQVFVPLTGVPGQPPSLTSALIFQTLFAQGLVQCTTPSAGNAACITPANLTQFGINVTNVGPPPPLSVVFSGQPNYQNPYSMQGSFGIEGEVAKDLSVSLGYIYVHTLRLPVAIDVNARPAFTTIVPGCTSTLTQNCVASGASVAVHNWNSRTPNPLNTAPCAGVAVVLCFANPLLLQTDQYSSAGSSLYHGFTLEVKKRFSNHYSLLGNYTFSKAIDTTTDFNSDFGPFDNTNLAGERGLSSFDQRHKVVVTGILATTSKSQFLGGWQLSPIFRWNSPHPFNLLAGADVNGDRHSTNDRPIGAGRNTGIGPNFIDFDLRLTKAFRLTEGAQLQFIAEGFNLANRSNFASVNNVVGPSCAECRFWAPPSIRMALATQ
ncbi:MAG TPA: carboxypeptidase regulatory-like domain-containing protein [Candidatus Angelobacter sp.]|nr:carboxypeptidase regulatory-like domain-containing protein [Candidatus Angelobacter sp.]